MGIKEGIDERLATWLVAQPIFFVSTAPLSDNGLLNCSPKGLTGSFVVLGEHQVAYLDLTGSGIETVAHLRENGRIVLMFCAFNGPPNIVRLHGTGAVVVPEDDRFAALAAKFPSRPGIRAIIVVDVARVSETCGFAVPFMDYVGDRDLLDRSSAKKGPEKLAAYRVEKNSHSLDGLPGLDPPV